MRLAAGVAPGLRVVSSEPIVVPKGPTILVTDLREVVERVNAKFRALHAHKGQLFSVFEVLDFRMMSGLVGEALGTELAGAGLGLAKNPNIDGYPDLLNAVTDAQRQFIEVQRRGDGRGFIKYPYGGIELKNTFGTKKASARGADLQPGMSRVGGIQSKLDWKAHHQETNQLLGLLSDFVDKCPQIVAVAYSDALEAADWTDKAQPKKDSTMTSFSVIRRSGHDKMVAGLRLCLDRPGYGEFFGLE
jgi:hypothetical protein